MFGRRKREEAAAAEAARESRTSRPVRQACRTARAHLPVPRPRGGPHGLRRGRQRRASLLRLRRSGADLRRAADARLPGARLRQLPALPARRPRHPDRGARGAAPAARRRGRTAATTPLPVPRPSRSGVDGSPLLALLALLLLVGAGAAPTCSSAETAASPWCRPPRQRRPRRRPPSRRPRAHRSQPPSPTIPLNAITRGELARLMADVARPSTGRRPTTTTTTFERSTRTTSTGSPRPA